jgi:hypothetical protein
MTISCDRLIKVESYKNEIEQYDKQFIDFKIDKSFENPYDQTEVKVDAKIYSPSKEVVILPCFNIDIDKKLWQARFTPRDTGVYSFEIVCSYKKVLHTSNKFIFRVKQGSKNGFLNIDSSDNYFLRFDNNKKFRGVGLNVGWEFEPKWDSKSKYTFKMFFDEMVLNNANTVRTWVCPWNFPIEWSPVKEYKIFVDEFTDFSKIYRYSDGFAINTKNSTVTQNDTGQLLIKKLSDQYIIYKLDTIIKSKIMIYYRENLFIDDIEIFYSMDDQLYTKCKTYFSDKWNLSDNWKRIFLFTEEIPTKNAKYLKIVFRNGIKPENIKIAGIQINYGEAIKTLDCGGLAKYSVKNSQKIDEFINLAEEKGIYIILTLGYHGQFNPVMDAWGANDEWQRNPYNVKNGGPCEQPADFFKNDKAKTYYKNYLRYFVARWGYSTAILAWEFWNEIDIAMRSQNIPESDIVNWHKEMSEYLKSIDPYNHLVTTSLSHGNLKGLWELKTIDITQIHRYEPSFHFVEKSTEMVEQFKKPHLIGEYAIGWKGPGNDYPASEYEGEFHDAMWRGMFSPLPIMPLSWWWDFHYDNKHYFHFKSLASVIKILTESNEKYKPISFQNNKNFELRGLQSDNITVVWVKKLSDKNIFAFNIPVLFDKEYNVRLFDTWTNEEIKNYVLKANNKVLFIEGNILKYRDIYFIIK